MSVAKAPLHPFLVSATEGSLSSIKTSFSPGGSSLIVDGEGRNALHLAVTEGHQELSVWLVDHGFDVEARSSKKGEKRERKRKIRSSLGGWMGHC